MLASEIGPVNDTISKVSKRTLKAALKKAGVSSRKLSGIAATGYGRKGVKTKREYPDTMCLAKAVHYLAPDVNIVMDIGGLVTRVVRIGKDGVVRDYLENERCASGSARCTGSAFSSPKKYRSVVRSKLR